MAERATASAAATVANLGPGYDVLGLCLEGPRDRVSAELTDDGQVTIVRITGDDGRLPLAAEENCVGVAARWVLDHYGRGEGIRLWLDKGLPLGSGLGSSAASSVAAAVATAALIDPDLPKAALLGACREGERLATGVPHADNVAPSLFGGLVACIPTPEDGIDVVRLSVPDDLVVAAVKPNYDIRTADARKVLPTHVPMVDAVANL
ncbi:MAG: homoserine kinase, partial [Myxococcota bacterium]